MKNITLLTLLLSALSFGQFFDQTQTDPQDTNESQFFDQAHQPQTGTPDPEYETYGPGNPAGAPIDDWAFLLPLAGLAVGVYFIRRRKVVNG